MDLPASSAVSDMDTPETDDVHDNPGTEETAVDSNLSDSAPLIRCRHCNRHFARISVEGELVPILDQAAACAFCEPFLGLFETLQTRESEHTALLDRGPKHHGRNLAHTKYRNARVALENFMIAVEAPDEATLGVTQAGFANREDPAQRERPNELETTNHHEDDQPTLIGSLESAENISPPQSSLTTKRKPRSKSNTSIIENKRIKFTDTVEERSRYRTTLEYQRGTEEYVPGRYVAAEGSEFLDTSGSNLTFAKFTGQKKMGSRFVDIVPKAEVQGDRTEAPRSRTEGKTRDEIVGAREPHHEKEQGESRTNGRASRNYERSRSTTPPATIRPQRRTAQYNDNDDPLRNSPNRSSLNINLPVPHRPDETRSTTNDEIMLTTNDEKAVQNSEHRSLGNADVCGPTDQATEAENIKRIVTNIQRELSHLQSITTSSRYKDLVALAVRGFSDILEPLTVLKDCEDDPSDLTDGVKEAILVSVDALNMTEHGMSSNISRSAENQKWDNAVLERSSAIKDLEEPHIADASFSSGDNASGVFSFGATRESMDLRADLLDPQVKEDKVRTPVQVKTGPEYFDTQSPCVCTDSEHDKNPSAHAHVTLDGISNTEEENVPAILCSASYLPSNEPSLIEEWYTPPSVHITTSKLMGTLVQQPPAPLFAISPNTQQTMGWQNHEFNGNEGGSMSISTDIDQTQETPTARPQYAQPSLISPSPPPMDNTAGGNSHGSTVSNNEETAQREPIPHIEPTLAALPVQPARFEEVESMHFRSGETNNGRNEQQGSLTRSESEPLLKDRQSSSIDQGLGIVHERSGEAAGKSEMHITDTNRPEAGEAAQVDPDADRGLA